MCWNTPDLIWCITMLLSFQILVNWLADLIDNWLAHFVYLSMFIMVLMFFVFLWSTLYFPGMKNAK